jgi:pimeloyl-ACP methyl ester carboxylesterase
VCETTTCRQNENLTTSGPGSRCLYYENFHATAAWSTIDVPTGYAMLPADMFRTPREWVERTGRVDRWAELDRGGHFPEQEVPELIARELRESLRPLR